MRVIGGRLRSRRLKPVPGLHTRPTPDRLREALFNVLTPRIANATFLDAYAGTGSVGIEALSRGADKAILIERSPAALAILRANLRALQLTEEAVVVRGSAAAVLSAYRCDIAFLDPPYEEIGEYQKAMVALDASQCPLVIAQHTSRFALEERYGTLHKQRVLKQGDNSLSFYERA